MIIFATSNVVSTIVKKGDFGSMMLQKISELESKSGVKLNLLQKIVLAETGTVEQALSILIDSPIRVRVLRQKENPRMITRDSIIESKDTGKPLIRAYSKAFTSNLPLIALDRIKQKQAGIGSIIHSLQLETFRRIIEVGYHPKDRLFFRKYQIIHNGKVAFEIEEELLLGESNRYEKI
jgi:chorismate-pyruvate lyase